MRETKPGNVLLGVTGSIAAYKAAEIVRLLKKRGHDVKVILTANGARFIGAETLAALSQHPVYSEMFAPVRTDSIEHISLSDWADVFVCAPATANAIGKFASGVADDLLSTTYLSCDCPVIIAPAMNVRMWANPSVVRNVERLRGLGVLFVGPEAGELACGTSGKGRMSAPESIVEAVVSVLGRGRDFAGLNVLVTAGPTREMIDPVRFISNRSSGKMGAALAQAALSRGANVTVVAGPISVALPSAATVVRVTSAEQMRQNVMKALPSQHVVIMAAAVSDYRPQKESPQKIKKGDEEIALALERTPDILKELRQLVSGKTVVVGFAAETADLVANARKKLLEKQLDLIVANDVSQQGSGFEADDNVGTLLWPNGRAAALPRMQKRALADRILDEILPLLAGKTEAP